jgi:RNase H-fold protein (predicted Holliday junction resolvase)
VDPGREKCGIAVVRADRRVLYRAVVPTSEIGDAVESAAREHSVERLVLGDRTAANEVRRLLGSRVELAATMIDEHRSTEQGRQRYFDENPPRGWRRLIPLGLQTPPRPYDDCVAVVLAERYLDSLSRA